MTSPASTLVVISYYDRRSAAHLEKLVASLERHEAGAPYQLVVVANRTSDAALNLPHRDKFRLLERPNTGMNIGAWDFGWRQNPGYGAYLFLQDECEAIRDQWLAGFRAKLEQPRVGLVGETLNTGWDQPWPALAKLHRDSKLPDHWIDGAPAARVDAYLDFLQRKHIDPGATGGHLRALVWMMSGDVLAAMDGFPIGLNYGECIAAEIGVSRLVAQRGLDVVQVRDEPFHFFRHFEWNRDHPGRPFTHARSSARSAGGRVLQWLKRLTGRERR